jgi:hypothetical protein
VTQFIFVPIGIWQLHPRSMPTEITQNHRDPDEKFLFAALAIVTLLTGTALQSASNATPFGESAAGMQGGANG